MYTAGRLVCCSKRSSSQTHSRAEPVVLSELSFVEDLSVRRDEREGERRDRIERDGNDLRSHDAGARFALRLLGVVGVREAGEDLLADLIALRKGVVEPFGAHAQEAVEVIGLADRDDAGAREAADDVEELVAVQREAAGPVAVAVEGGADHGRFGDLTDRRQLPGADGRGPVAEVAHELVSAGNGPH